MNDTEKNLAALNMADMLDAIDTLILMNTDIYDTELQEVTPELWVAYQEGCIVSNTVLEYLKESIKVGARLMNNDALLSHATAAVLAED